MHPVTGLVCFGIRQVLGVDVENVAEAVEKYYTDQSQALPRALAAANDKAWRTLGVALGGDSFLAKFKRLFTASGDEKAFSEQVGRLLASEAISFEGSPADFRGLCLAELTRALKNKVLSVESLPREEVARRTADFRRYGDPQALVKGAEEAAARVAKALAPSYPNLARLLEQPTPGGPPLLVAAFSYFFRREVEKDDELANGLLVEGIKQLGASQAEAFMKVGRALNSLGERFDQALGEMAEELERTRRAAEQAEKVAHQAEEAAKGARAAAVETRVAVLDLQAELQHLGRLQVANAEIVRRLFQEVMARLDRAEIRPGEVRPQYGFSIRGEDERRAVKQLLARIRQLPEGERRQIPALVNGGGKLAVGTGEFAEAGVIFAEVARAVDDPRGKAEAFYNAYRAALEERKWDEALHALRQAADLEPGRFAPFPMERYRPRKILGAGGFGTVFWCQDAFFRNRDVAVKTLHASDLERGVDEVFSEAHALIELNDPAIIGVLDCSYADVANRRRPYIVMQYFPGESLEKFLQERGALSTEQMLAVARQVASGMKNAHAHGILHRDLKPDNVLVREEGGRWQVKVIDFGLALRREAIEASTVAGSSAKTILAQSVAGTLKYAPPEQLGDLPGVKPGPYSDVYAFGKTCCYALFKTTQPTTRHWKTIPQQLHEVLEGCIENDLEHRLQDFGPVLAALEALQQPQRAGQGAEQRDRAEAAESGPKDKPAPHRQDLREGRVQEPARPQPTSPGPVADPAPTQVQPPAPGPTRFTCPHCKTTLKSANPLPAGKKVKCPKCHAAFVPGETSVMSNPAALQPQPGSPQRQDVSGPAHHIRQPLARQASPLQEIHQEPGTDTQARADGPVPEFAHPSRKDPLTDGNVDHQRGEAPGITPSPSVRFGMSTPTSTVETDLALINEQRRQELLAAARALGERLVEEALARTDRERQEREAAAKAESAGLDREAAQAAEAERFRHNEERRRHLLATARAEGERLVREALARADRERLDREAAAWLESSLGHEGSLGGPHFHLAQQRPGCKGVDAEGLSI